MRTISSRPGDAEGICIRDVTKFLRQSSIRSHERRHELGQSMVEFVLIVPILLVLLVGIADFGRIFAAGVSLEAATRDAAEAAANEYLSNPPFPLDSAAPVGNQPYYDSLHAYAAGMVCSELRSLRDTTFDPATQTCRDPLGVGPDLPVVLVCVHDGADAGCDVPASPGTGGIPASCSDLTTPSTSSQGGTAQRWVEVRTCHHFTSILQMPLFSLGDIWLQRTRTFVIPCYFVRGTEECGTT